MSTERDPRPDPALTAEHRTPGAGRPVVLEPMPPGWWPVIAGAVLAALGPLFGFLLGSMIGQGDGDGTSPLYVWLLIGMLVGGVGILVALWGARTILERRGAEDEAAVDAA